MDVSGNSWPFFFLKRSRATGIHIRLLGVRISGVMRIHLLRLLISLRANGLPGELGATTAYCIKQFGIQDDSPNE